MASGIWTAAAGAVAQQEALEIVANNLANSDSLGFKKDAPTFKQYLSTVERDHGPQDIPRGQFKDRDFYPLDGKDQAFVIMDGTYTNFRQGPLRVTDSKLDVAMDGPGFLEVSTPNGIRYTRNGALKMGLDGRLVTSEGMPVLAAAAGGIAAPAVGGTPADVAGRFINLRDRSRNINISASGELYAGDELVAKLSVVEFTDLNKLRKTGAGLLENGDPVNVVVPQRTQVRQGVLEGSNVNPIEEMTNMIKANRLFEHDLKAMKTYSEMLGREVNDIGKL